MDCSQAREGISAVLDGEDPGLDVDALDAHLATCAGCSAWREAAHDVTRRSRMRLAPAPPRPGAPTFPRSLPENRPFRRPDRLGTTRLALLVTGLAELAVAVPALILGQDHGAPLHVAHEAGSFDAALAVGFVVAAWRPARALGMQALVGVAALLLVVTAGVDLLGGRTDLLDEAPHLVVVAGWLLIRRVAVLSSGTTGAALPARPTRTLRFSLGRPGRIVRRARGVPELPVQPRFPGAAPLDRSDGRRLAGNEQ